LSKDETEKNMWVFSREIQFSSSFNFLVNFKKWRIRMNFIFKFIEVKLLNDTASSTTPTLVTLINTSTQLFIYVRLHILIREMRIAALQPLRIWEWKGTSSSWDERQELKNGKQYKWDIGAFNNSSISNKTKNMGKMDMEASFLPANAKIF